jgi:hypothetical protein
MLRILMTINIVSFFLVSYWNPSLIHPQTVGMDGGSFVEFTQQSAIIKVYLFEDIRKQFMNSMVPEKFNSQVCTIRMGKIQD